MLLKIPIEWNKAKRCPENETSFLLSYMQQ